MLSSIVRRVICGRSQHLRGTLSRPASGHAANPRRSGTNLSGEFLVVNLSTTSCAEFIITGSNVGHQQSSWYLVVNDLLDSWLVIHTLLMRATCTQVVYGTQGLSVIAFGESHAFHAFHQPRLRRLALSCYWSGPRVDLGSSTARIINIAQPFGCFWANLMANIN